MQWAAHELAKGHAAHRVITDCQSADGGVSQRKAADAALDFARNFGLVLRDHLVQVLFVVPGNSLDLILAVPGVGPIELNTQGCSTIPGQRRAGK